jgi:hypothetical protein
MSYRETFTSLVFAMQDALQRAWLMQQNYEVRTENGDPVYTAKAQSLQHVEGIDDFNDLDFMVLAEDIIEAQELENTFEPKSDYTVVWVP